MKKELKKDLFVICLIPLLILIGIFYFSIKINYLTSTLLFWGLPSLYLSLKNKHKVKKILLFSLMVGIPLAFIIYLIARLDNAWYVPYSVFPFRLINSMTLEDLIWMFLGTYLIVMFHEHFFENNKNYEIKKHLKYFFYSLIILFAVLFIIYLINPIFLSIPYSYLFLGTIILLIPTIIFLINFPSYIKTFFMTSLYIFPIFLILELIGVKLGHWVFEGTNNIGWVSLFNIAFPFEEFFFVIILSSFAALSYYEFFANKNKIRPW